MRRHTARIERLERATGANQPTVRLFYLQEDGSIESNGETFTREQYDDYLRAGGRAIFDDLPILIDEAARGV